MIIAKSVWCILFAYAEENEVDRGLKTIKGNTLHVLTGDGSQYGGAMVEDRPGGDRLIHHQGFHGSNVLTI